MSDQNQLLEFPVEEGGERLDRFLADQLPDTSRAEVQRWVKEERATVGGKPAKASLKLAAGDVVTLLRPARVEVVIAAEDIPLAVLYEDDDVLVVNKPAGRVTHPATGQTSGTLVNALLARYPAQAQVGGPERAGIVHRLDRDTSGALVVAKTAKAFRHLQGQFKRRQVDKTYLTLVDGLVEVLEGRVDAPIGRDPAHRKRMAVIAAQRGGRRSVSEFRVLRIYRSAVSQRGDYFTLLDVDLLTGRTHQIRVHLAFIKHPVVGDRVYGRTKQRIACPRQFLHARRLAFTQPTSGERITVEAPVPDDLNGVLAQLIELDPHPSAE
ncbi:MAG: RluA family pseudouridine synthase [Caldilineales bacterium]